MKNSHIWLLNKKIQILIQVHTNIMGNSLQISQINKITQINRIISHNTEIRRIKL